MRRSEPPVQRPGVLKRLERFKHFEWTILTAGLAASGFFVIWINMTRTLYYLNADDVGTINLLFRSMWEHGSLIPRGYIYSNDLFILSGAPIGALLYGLTGDLVLAGQLANLVMAGLTGLALLYLVRAFTREAKTSVLALTLWFGYVTMDSLWLSFFAGGFYAGSLLFSFLYLGFFARISRAPRLTFRSGVVGFLLMASAFVLGMSSMRSLMNFVVPLCGCAAVSVAYRFWIGRRPAVARGDLFAALLLIVSGAGAAFYQKYLYQFAGYHSFTFTVDSVAGVLRSVPARIEQFLIMFGVRGGMKLLSLEAVAPILRIAALLGLGVGFFAALRHWRQSRARAFLVFYAVLFAAVGFILLVSDTLIPSRYYYAPFFFALPLAALLIDQIRSGRNRALMRVASVCLVAVNMLCVLRVELPNRGQNPPPVFAQASAWLTENGYALGAATYWNASVFTAYTNGRIDMTQIGLDGKPFPVVADSELYLEGHHTGKAFLFLAPGEQPLLQAHPCFAPGQKVWELEGYAIYSYESNPFTVLTFPEAGETATQTLNRFGFDPWGEGWAYEGGSLVSPGGSATLAAPVITRQAGSYSISVRYGYLDGDAPEGSPGRLFVLDAGTQAVLQEAELPAEGAATLNVEVTRAMRPELRIELRSGQHVRLDEISVTHLPSTNR